jgi:prepilin-type N-terminal cleavage/methylation domain-containing protein
VATRLRSDAGFTLAELLIATGLLLVVSSIVTSALLQMTNQQQTIWNRTEMHSGVRGATELLQQEVGQAGRIALPNPVTAGVIAGVPASPTACQQVNNIVLSTPVAGADPVAGMWYDAPTNTGITLTFLDGDNAESVRINALNTVAKTISGCFWFNHGSGTTPVVARGSFANGIVPPSPPSVLPNGSDANHLKLFGDINGDGNMVYIEYVCDNGDIAGVTPTFNLYRNVMAFTTAPASKPTISNSMILLSNVHPNPPDAGGVPRPCFQYQMNTPAVMMVQGAPFTFVLDVAVTLTVWTQSLDPITKQYQTETKALLNVSPRNVFFAWELAGIGYTDRIQSTPASISALLAVPSVP